MDIVLENTSKQDQRIARVFMEQLKDVVDIRRKSRGVKIRLGEQQQSLVIPDKAFSLLVEILGNMADGKSNAIVPADKLLTTQQAASILNISRPYLVKLLEGKQIPFTKAGTHRRLELKDVLEYKNKRKATRRSKLDYLAKQSQKLNLY